MNVPHRIQRSRKAGWRKPPNTMIVDRTSRWGNPFLVEAAKEAGYADPRETAVCAFRDWLAGIPWACGIGERYEDRRARILAEIGKLRGKDLACTCPLDQPCHADVLLALANKDRP